MMTLEEVIRESYLYAFASDLSPNSNLCEDILSQAIRQWIKKRLTEEEISGALARGYCHKDCEKKIVDPTLIMAMTKEIQALVNQSLGEEMMELKPFQVWEIEIECSLLTCILLSKDKYTKGQTHSWDSKGYHRTKMIEGDWWCVATTHKGMGGTHCFLNDEEILKGKYLGYVIDYDTGDILAKSLGQE